MPAEVREGVGSSAIGVTGGYEQTVVDAGSRTPVLWKGSSALPAEPSLQDQTGHLAVRIRNGNATFRGGLSQKYRHWLFTICYSLPSTDTFLTGIFIQSTK